jgi:hypothetical protein
MPGFLSSRQLFRSALLEYSDPSKCINSLFATFLYCLDIKFCRVVNAVFFLLGDSIACEFYVPTFRHTLFRLYRSCEQEGYVNTSLEDGTDCSETSAHKIQTPWNPSKERIYFLFTGPIKMEQIVPKRRHI